MSTPRFLSLSVVLELHRDSIREYGGDPSVRDMGLLESAISQPRATFGGAFLHGDLAEMAAAYLFHIAKNHPFVDGNKRTAAFAAYAFLRLNDIAFDPPEEDFYRVTLAVAAGEAHKEDAVAFFRKYIKAKRVRRKPRGK